MSGTANPPATKTPETEVAKKILEKLGYFETKLPELENQMKIVQDIAKTLEGLGEGFDAKKLMSEVDRLKAGYDQITEQIANNPLTGIPGLGDKKERSKFSMVRACLGARYAKNDKDWDTIAPYEKRVIEEYRSKASHVIGVDSQGGFFVPDQVIPDVIAAIYTRSVFVDLAGDGQTRVSVLDGLTGIPAKIPKFDGGMIAYWIGEEDDYVESSTKVGNVSMTPKKLGILTRLTDEMRRFQGFGFEGLFRRDMSRAGAKKIDWTIPYGTGTENMPRGFCKMPDVTVFSAEKGYRILGDGTFDLPADAAGAEFTFDTADEMLGALEDQDLQPNESFAWISNPRLWRRFRKQKISYFSGQTVEKGYQAGLPILTDAVLNALVGNFDRTTQIPVTNKPGATLGWTTTSTTAKFGDVFAGNWSEVLFGRWSGIEIVDDEGKGTGFKKDETYIKMRMYCDIGHRQEKSIIICPDARMIT